MDRLIKIFEVFTDEAEQIAVEPDEPHHHDFEELLIGTEGVLDHFIDFNSQLKTGLNHMNYDLASIMLISCLKKCRL